MARRPETPLYQLPLELGRPVEPPAHGYQIRTGIVAEHRPREPLVDRSLWAMAEPIRLRSPEDAVRHLMTLVYTPWEQCVQEELWILLLNNRNIITHEMMAYRGTVNSIGNVRIAEIFRPAVLVNSPAILLAHNHPSATTNVEPSPVIWRKSQISWLMKRKKGCHVKAVGQVNSHGY
ncbi:MAG TPA: JAB domain-containing protein [Caldilineaceae bacterium]|nr:JAB domain-containing protein [Caldilineaceae bacterium]